MSGTESKPFVLIEWNSTNSKGSTIKQNLEEILKHLNMKSVQIPHLLDNVFSCTIQFETESDAKLFIDKARENEKKLNDILAGFKFQKDFVGTCHNQEQNNQEDNDIPPYGKNDFIEIQENAEDKYRVCRIIGGEYHEKDKDWEFNVQFEDGETQFVRETESESIRGPITVFICPTPDCHGWMKVDRVDKDGCGKCGKCSFTSCIKCNARPFHNGKNCDEYKKEETIYQTKLKENDDQLFWQLAKKNGWKKCPKCEKIQERPFGCFHLICINDKCKAHYCDECGKPLKSGKWQDHFGKELQDTTGQEKNKCRLWRMEKNYKNEIVQGYGESARVVNESSLKEKKMVKNEMANEMANEMKNGGQGGDINENKGNKVNEGNEGDKENTMEKENHGSGNSNDSYDPDYDFDFEEANTNVKPLGEVQDPATNVNNSDKLCEICRNPLTWDEFIHLTSQSQIGKSQILCHQRCQSKQQLPAMRHENRLWHKQFVGNTSQFKEESTGSCTINGLEAAIQLQLRKTPSVQLVDKIVGIASVYKADKHTGMEDIFPSISRYHESLEQIDYLQLLKSAGHVLFKTMHNLVDKYGHAISCVVTAPPESFFLHLDYDGSVTMFDSHPRGHLGLENSHFLLFENSEKCLEYLRKELLKCVKLDVNDISAYQLQAMNAFEANLLMLKSNAKVNDTPDIEQLKRELRRVDDRLNKQYAFESRKHGNDYSDLLNEKNKNSQWYNDNDNNNNNSKNNEEWKRKEMSYQNRVKQLEMELESLKCIVNESGDSDTVRHTMMQYAQKVQTLTDRNKILTQQCEQMGKDMLNMRNEYNRRSNKDDEKLDYSSAFQSNHATLQQQFYCFLCNDFKKEHEKVSLSNCNCDNLCRDCVIQYITKKINQKEVEIQCPKCHDSKNITEDDIGKLSGTLFRQYQGLVNEHFNKEKQQSWNLIHCQNNKCNYNGLSGSWIEYKKVYLICPSCKVCRFCKDCGLGELFHRGFADCKTASLRANNPKRFMACENCQYWTENKTYKDKKYKPLRQCDNCSFNVCFKCAYVQSETIYWHKCNECRFK